MKINDEKRREVAARMRDIMRRHPRCFLDNMVAQSVLDLMGDGVKIGEIVAELIDRPTCRNEGGELGFFCSECGEDCLNTKKIPCGVACTHIPNYCPNCGAEVVE